MPGAKLHQSLDAETDFVTSSATQMSNSTPSVMHRFSGNTISASMSEISPSFQHYSTPQHSLFEELIKVKTEAGRFKCCNGTTRYEVLHIQIKPN